MLVDPGFTTGALVTTFGPIVVPIAICRHVDVVALYRRFSGHWMMYIRPYLSHWMNLVLSVGWGKYTWLLGLFVHGFGTLLKASVV